MLSIPIMFGKFHMVTNFTKAMGLAGLITLGNAAIAQVAPVSASAAVGDEAVEDIIVNQTVTVAGQEFHAAFATLWADKPVIAGYGLAIRERPSARRGTTVEVEHLGRIIFRAFLPPSRAQIRPLAEQAVDLVYEHAVAAQVQQLVRDADLAPDEI